MNLYRWKYRIILYLGIIVSVLWPLGVTAQNGINAPFSQYGIGSNNMPFNMPAMSAMGGIAYTRSNSNMVNPFNPASYTSIAKETFVFDMGLSIDMTRLSDKNDYLSDGDGNIGYLLFGLPLTSWWKGAFGIMPLSDVNYQSINNDTREDIGELKTVYDGTGGVTEFFLGNAFRIVGGDNADKPRLSAGFNVNYLYGNITRGVTYKFSGNDSTYFMNSRRQKDTYIRNLTFDFGLLYEHPLGENHLMSVGLTMKPSQSMSVKDNSLVYTYVMNAGYEYMRDTIFPAEGQDSEYESLLEQPMTLGMGLSFQRNDKWLVALDATLASWNGLKYSENSDISLFGSNSLMYDPYQRFSFGFQFLGDKNAANYLRRVTFSAGVHYENGTMHLKLTNGNEHFLNGWGAGVGMALPMRKGRSVANISFSYSSFGDKEILRQDIFSIGISIGSCESWFVKRKFN